MGVVMGCAGRGVGFALAVAFVAPAGVAAEPLPIAAIDRKQPVRFQEDVRPFLAANCVACHNARTKEGGLALETVATIVAGGDSGPGVVAGKPAESLLLVRAAHRDVDADAMPPEGNSVGARNLSPEELGLLERWIVEGAAAGPATRSLPIAWRPLPPGTGPVVCVDMTADGRLTAAARGSRVSLFDTISGVALGNLVDGAASGDGPAVAQAHRDPVGAIAFAPAGDRIATASFRTIKLWKRDAPRIAPLAITAPATAGAVSPDGRHAALGLPDGTLAIVEAISGMKVHVHAVHDTAIKGLAFAADGATIYSVAMSGAVAATTVADGATTGRLARPAGTAAVAVLDAGRLVTAEPDNVMRVWGLPLPTTGAEAPSAPAPVKELAGMPHPVIALAGVPTLPGHLVAGGGDGKARLWHADTGVVVREFDHGGPIAALAVRPDGSRLATAGSVAGVKLWNLADGKLVADPRGDVRLVRRLAAADLALSVEKQDVEFGKARVTAAEKDVTDAVVDKNKAAEAVSTAEKALAEKTAGVVAADKAKGEAAAAVAAAQAAVPLATAAHAAAVKLQAAATATAESAAASLAAFTQAEVDPAATGPLEAAQAAVAAATAARTAADAAVVQAAVHLERVQAKVPEAEKKAAEAGAAEQKAQEDRARADAALTSAKRAVAFAESREKQAQEELPRRKAESESLEKRLGATTEARGRLAQEVKAAELPATAVAFSPDGQWLAGLGADGRLTIVGGADGGLRDTFEAARPAGAVGPPGMLAFAGDRLIVAGAGAPAASWDLRESWMLERTIGGESTPAAGDDDPGGPPLGTVTAVAFSPDGRLLASGSGRASRDGEIKLWNVENGMLARVLPRPHADTIMALAFSPRGDVLASGAADRFVKVHAVADGSVVRSLEGHTGHVLALSWQAHGRRLASAGADNSVRIWDMVTGERQRMITGPKKEVTGVRFLGASDEIIVSAADPLVRLYNVGTGAVLREFDGASGFLQTLAAVPPLVAAGGQDGRVRLWNLADAKLLHAVEPAPARP